MYTLENSSQLELIMLDEIASTNDYLKSYNPPYLKKITLVTAECQTKGRGQRGNSWESERGKNLLFSLLITSTNVVAHKQFIISQAISLALTKVLNGYADGFCIKWPNDIYWQNQKVAGILIENELMGRTIEKCIIGVGVNINQQRFRSDAPNPISLRKIVGKEVNRRFVLDAIVNYFGHYLEEIESGNHQAIADAYHLSLYRNRGTHHFIDKIGLFAASIKKVESNGKLVLTDQEGIDREYQFKEVQFVIDK